MSEKLNAIKFTEEVFLAIEDLFIADITCGLTDITVRFVSGEKFTISIEQE